MHKHAIAVGGDARRFSLSLVVTALQFEFADFEFAVLLAPRHRHLRICQLALLERKITFTAFEFGVVAVVIQGRDELLGQRRVDFGGSQRCLRIDQRGIGLDGLEFQLRDFLVHTRARLRELGFQRGDLLRGSAGVDTQQRVALLHAAAVGKVIAQHHRRRIRRRHEHGL